MQCVTPSPSGTWRSPSRVGEISLFEIFENNYDECPFCHPCHQSEEELDDHQFWIVCKRPVTEQFLVACIKRTIAVKPLIRLMNFVLFFILCTSLSLIFWYFPPHAHVTDPSFYCLISWWRHPSLRGCTEHLNKIFVKLTQTSNSKQWQQRTSTARSQHAGVSQCTLRVCKTKKLDFFRRK